MNNLDGDYPFLYLWNIIWIYVDYKKKALFTFPAGFLDYLHLRTGKYGR